MAASAKQLGIAAVASLSVMTASFSAIAYNGYRESIKKSEVKKDGQILGENRFQQVFYNTAETSSNSVAEDAVSRESLPENEETGSDTEENEANSTSKKKAKEESAKEPESEKENAEKNSAPTESSAAESAGTQGAKPEESAAATPAQNPVQSSAQSTAPEAKPAAVPAAAPLPKEDLNDPTTVEATADDAQTPPVIPVKTDPFEKYYGTSTFNDYNVYLDTALGPMSYYNQHDSHWGSYLYGGKDSISKYGCGPTTAAMIVSAFGNVNGSITPKEMANWSAAYGYYAPKSGSYHDYIPAVLSAFDLIVDSVSAENRTPAGIADLLNNGHILVALMGKGALTNGGHFIIITKQNPNGTVSIADPNSYPNTQKDWDPAQLMRELKKNYDAGGPLWSVRIAR
jgi:hypothetical protein